MGGDKSRAFTIEVEGLEKSYSGRKVLKNISLYVGAGEKTVIVGPNGSGKTTLIKCILGLTKCRARRLSILGSHPRSKSFSKLRRLVGYMPEKVALSSTIKVEDYLYYLARIKGCSDYSDEVDLLELRGYLGYNVKSLSQGYKRRVLLAGALLCKPRVLILDEPYSNIDIETRAVIDSALSQLSWSPTILMASHVKPGIEDYKMVILVDGEIVGEKRVEGEICGLKLACKNGEKTIRIQATSGAGELEELNSLIKSGECTISGVFFEGFEQSLAQILVRARKQVKTLK